MFLFFVALLNVSLPDAWALKPQTPVVSIVTMNSDTVHTPVANDMTVTDRPESDVAVTVNGVTEKTIVVAGENVIV